MNLSRLDPTTPGGMFALAGLLATVTPFALAVVLKSTKALWPGVAMGWLAGTVIAGLASSPYLWLLIALDVIVVLIGGVIWVNQHTYRTHEVVGVQNSREQGMAWWWKKNTPVTEREIALGEADSKRLAGAREVYDARTRYLEASRPQLNSGNGYELPETGSDWQNPDVQATRAERARRRRSED